MSTIFKSSNLSSKIREMKIGDIQTIELQDGVSFKKGMSSISAMATRLGISISQSGVKVVPVTSTEATVCHNAIRLERVL